MDVSSQMSLLSQIYDRMNASAPIESGYDDFQCDAKRIINGTFIPNILADHDNGGRIVVLDGANMQTTRNLIVRGFAGSRIDVVEHDVPTARRMMSRISYNRMFGANDSLGHVTVHRNDVFAWLRAESDATSSCLFALVLDGMQADYSMEAYQAIATAALQRGAQYLFLTFSSRGATSFARRLGRLRSGPVGRVFRGLRMAYGYQRAANRQPMFFVAMQRRPLPARETLYRPLAIRDRSADGRKVLTQWAGWPKRTDYTWERTEDIVLSSDDAGVSAFPDLSSLCNAKQ